MAQKQTTAKIKQHEIAPWSGVNQKDQIMQQRSLTSWIIKCQELGKTIMKYSKAKMDLPTREQFSIFLAGTFSGWEIGTLAGSLFWKKPIFRPMALGPLKALVKQKYQPDKTL